VPKRIITDKLRSYGAAKREVAPGIDHWSHKGLNNRAEKQPPARAKTRAGDAGFPITGWIAAFRLSAVRNPQSFLRTSPPSFRSQHPLPSARSIRGVEIRGTCRLINDRHANLQTRRVNVTIPFRYIRMNITTVEVTHRDHQDVEAEQLISSKGKPPNITTRPAPNC